MNYQKKTALAAALANVVGTSTIASADVIHMQYAGWFTMLNPAGTDVIVNGDASGNDMYGRRTAVNGTMTFDTVTGAGSGSMAPFSFFGSGGASRASAISFQSVGNGLLLGNMTFIWKFPDTPVSIVLDASGFFGAVAGGLTTSDTVSGVGSLAATDDFLFNFGKFSYTLPIGPVPMATTTFNTTDIGTVIFSTNPSGTLPLTDDSIGGSPIKAGPFPSFNANFDITTIHVNSIDTGQVPVPAAVWLFGSGLIGLVGIARCKKTA